MAEEGLAFYFPFCHLPLPLSCCVLSFLLAVGSRPHSPLPLSFPTLTLFSSLSILSSNGPGSFLQ
jgi:hypothetical protein